MADQCAPCLQGQELMIPLGGQRPEHPGFTAPDQAYDCRACVHHWGQRTGFPDLLPENYRAWELFFRVQDQQRAGGMDVIGLDYTILDLAFRLYEVPPEEQRLLFEKITLVNHEATKRREQKRAADEKVREQQRQHEAGITRLDK